MSMRRVAAAFALLLVVGVVVVTIATVVGDLPRFLAQLALLLIFLSAGWVSLTHSGWQRILAAIVVVAAIVSVVVLQVADEDNDLLSLVLRIAVLCAALGLAHYAIGTSTKALQGAETPGTPVAPAKNGVLFMNLKSGGGKAERFHLVDECRARGIEPVVLEGGQDWVAIIRETAPKHDVVGMAGGDGSQALVGSIAAELGLPMVVVPAGTRNHLALDLGLDRDDVVGALDAYAEAVERPMDLADVNGKVFVNNVSLGLYAAIVRSPEYRDAKVDTTLATLPRVLGPNTKPFDLRFDGPDGHHDGAHVIQVSNNPYGDSLAAIGQPAATGHGPARGGVPGHRQRSRAEERPLDGGRAGRQGSRAVVVVDTGLRGRVGSADRGRPGRRDAGDGLTAPVLDQARSGQGPAAEVRDRVLTRGPVARLGGIVARPLGGAPGKARAHGA